MNKIQEGRIFRPSCILSPYEGALTCVQIGGGKCRRTVGAVDEPCALAGGQVSVIVVVAQVAAHLGVVAEVMHALGTEDAFHSVQVLAVDGLGGIVGRDDDVVIGALTLEHIGDAVEQ